MAWGNLHEVDLESGSERSWELSSQQVTAGRLTNTKADKELTIKWAKPFVSGLHFSIRRSEDGKSFEIYDKSSNGTYVNECLIGKGKSRYIKGGDEIQLRFRNETKISLKFTVYDDTVEPEHGTVSGKRHQREADSSTSDKPKYAKYDKESTISSMRIAALEQENKQQEELIECYITKLETSSRENSSLLQQLKTIQDAVTEKDNELADAKQHCSELEANNTASEARAKKLEESLRSQKDQIEQLREQLAASEKKITLANELKIRIETLTDELNRRKSQNEARSTLCEELSSALEAAERKNVSLQQQIADLKVKLSSAEEVVSAKSNTVASLREKNKNLENDLQNIQKENETILTVMNKIRRDNVDRKCHMQESAARICTVINNLHTEAENLASTMQTDQMQTMIDDLLNSMNHNRRKTVLSDADDVSDEGKEVDDSSVFPSSTQVCSPERLRSTESTTSRRAMFAATQNGISTQDSSASKVVDNTEYNRQSFLLETVSMTEDEVDHKSFNKDLIAQQSSPLHKAVTISDNTQAGSKTPPSKDLQRVVEEGSESGNNDASNIPYPNEIPDCNSSDESSMLIGDNNEDEYDVPDDMDMQ